jgi:hypothetical protein
MAMTTNSSINVNAAVFLGHNFILKQLVSLLRHPLLSRAKDATVKKPQNEARVMLQLGFQRAGIRQFTPVEADLRRLQGCGQEVARL